MPRKAPKIKITDRDRQTLLDRVKRRTLPKQTIERAKMILDCADGKLVKQIADELDTYPNKIIY